MSVTATRKPNHGARLAPALPALILVLLSSLAGGCGDTKSDAENIAAGLSEVNATVTRVVTPVYEAEVIELRYPYLPEQPGLVPGPGEMFALVRVTLWNRGEPPVAAASGDFRLETEDGIQYEPIAATGLDEELVILSPAPGSEETGSLLFRLPAGARPLALREDISGQSGRIELPAPSA